MITYPINAKLQSILGASRICVTNDGDIILALSIGGSERIGHIANDGYIKWHSPDPEPHYRDAVRAALVDYALEHANMKNLHEAWALHEGWIELYVNGTTKLLNPGAQWRHISENEPVAKIKCGRAKDLDRQSDRNALVSQQTRNGVYRTTEDHRKIDYQDAAKPSLDLGDPAHLEDKLRDMFRQAALASIESLTI